MFLSPQISGFFTQFGALPVLDASVASSILLHSAEASLRKQLDKCARQILDGEIVTKTISVDLRDIAASTFAFGYAQEDQLRHITEHRAFAELKDFAEHRNLKLNYGIETSEGIPYPIRIYADVSMDLAKNANAARFVAAREQKPGWPCRPWRSFPTLSHS